jgi:hypothetical protein
MNAEEDKPNSELPEELKRVIDDIENSLREEMGLKRAEEKQQAPVGGVGAQMAEALRHIARLSGSEAQRELTRAMQSLPQAREAVSAALKRMGVGIVLFTKHNTAPLVMTDATMERIRHPNWKIHSFAEQDMRVNDTVALFAGDKLVVVATDNAAVRLLSYYVCKTHGAPYDDDYKAECDFAGGCSVFLDAFASCEPDYLNSLLRDTMFDSAIATPPVSSDLDDLLNDHEFQMMQDLL